MGRMGSFYRRFPLIKDTEVSEKYLLGQEGKGFYACMEGFNVARVVVAAACLGGAEKCIEIAADYAKQRKAFGRTLSKFQGIFLRSGRSIYAVRPAQDPVDARRLDDR